MLIQPNADNIVLLTGAVDYVSDGERVIAVENGHELLGQVTGVCLLTNSLNNM
jgi:hydroxyethylthiazole kinase-like sugar kinase family protein